MTGLYVASNPTALSARFGLANTMGELGNVLTRLSTGLRVNSGKDDPAGLIASEALKAQITGTTTAIKNTQRANSVIATADASMGQIGNLLNDIKGLVVEAANTGAMTAEQVAANQMQVNASIDSINRIAQTTSYNGKKLLDGSMDFRTTGVDGSNISNLQINSANFGTASAIGVNVNVQQAASNAALTYKGTGVSQQTTLDISGNVGTKTLTFGAGTSNAEIANAINAANDSTGVSAFVEGQAQRGNVILSSAGKNNDILITSRYTGLDAGNYSFRITQGATNDARIVQDPAGGKAGVVEISLQGQYQHTYHDFAGLFDITINTNDRDDGTGTIVSGSDAATAVSMTRGTVNKVAYHDTDTEAIASLGGKTITATAAGSERMSELNGWTIKVDNSAAASGLIDADTKTIYVNQTDANNNLADVVNQALAGTAGVGTSQPNFTFAIAGGALTAGESLTFAGGASAGEVEITYKEGATANEILSMLNSTPNVKATLKDGVNGSTLIPALPNGKTYTSTASSAGVNTLSNYTSSATAQQVIDLINSKLGDKFDATALKGDTGGGLVSFMDAAADYGDINLDNALRFTGMDNGPVIRLTNLGADGKPVANQQLAIKIIHPSENDIKAGIHTPILEIQLATDAAGNSITTAKDIAALFDKLTPEKTLGVSAEVLYPPGVDPNGRIFGVDACGNAYELESCPPEYGLGIVKPTEKQGVCAPGEGDLVLLGSNQNIADDYAIARITSGTPWTGTPAIASGGSLNAAGVATAGKTEIQFGNTNAFNGMQFGFTTDETKEGFDEATGTLITYLGPADQAGIVEANAALNGAIAANWEAIRAYTGATSEYDNVLHKANIRVLADVLADAGTGDTVGISAYGQTPTDDQQGFAASDPSMFIKAKTAGTGMAGITIHFINDTSAGLAEHNSSSTSAVPAIAVEMRTATDGTRELIVKANISGGMTVDAKVLADALNANADFTKDFEATALLSGTTANTVLFNTDYTKPQGQTVGGYRVNSPNAVGTSAGISMTGQADENERLVLFANDLGSDGFVNVAVRQGSFTTYDAWDTRTSYTTGTDAVATINGSLATAKGNNISVDTTDLSVSMTIGNTPGWSSFTIDGGGSLFQLGPDVVSTQQMRVGISSMMATRLGGASGKLFELKTGNAADLTKSDESRKLADKIVNEAIASVAGARGRLGAIQKATLEPNISYLQDSLVALTEANQSIVEADFAEESSNLTRLQLLMQAGSQALALAGQIPQYAAQLVG